MARGGDYVPVAAMKSKATIVEMPEIHLVVCKADEVPSGIRASWRKLESKLPSLRGRKFYGLSYMEGNEMIYYAGVVPLNDAEVASLGFPRKVIEGGRYARVKLMDWSKHLNEIPAIFDELIQEFKMGNGPAIEYYRSQYELYLMIPIAE